MRYPDTRSERGKGPTRPEGSRGVRPQLAGDSLRYVPDVDGGSGSDGDGATGTGRNSASGRASDTCGDTARDRDSDEARDGDSDRNRDKTGDGDGGSDRADSSDRCDLGP